MDKKSNMSSFLTKCGRILKESIKTGQQLQRVQILSEFEHII